MQKQKHGYDEEFLPLVQALESLAARESEMANDYGRYRMQLEALLLQAMQLCAAEFAFLLCPAGTGNYAEQFVKLGAMVQRTKSGGLQAVSDSLTSRRPDPLQLSVMRLRRNVQGSSDSIGLPRCLPRSYPPIEYLQLAPVMIGEGRIAVMILANPDFAHWPESAEDLLAKIEYLGEAMSSLCRELDAASILETRVRSAVERQEFSLVYQPQFRIDDQTIVSFEALLRWTPTDIDPPTTESLINVLETCGCINDVGNWVLQTACVQFRQWLDMGLVKEQCTISINVSAAQLSRSHFASRLARILEQCRLPAANLNLEITETAMIEKNSRCMQVINDVKAMGVRLSLDDFGTGYASFSYLTQLPIDVVKIDKSFVMTMITDDSSRAIVMSMLAVASTLNINVVAEGIEDTATLENLLQAQCQFGQGYLISRPVTANAIEVLLVRNLYPSEDVLLLS